MQTVTLNNGVEMPILGFGVFQSQTTFSAARIEPAGGVYERTFGEFILPYRSAVETEDPDATVLAFLESTYGAGATLAGWDREALERR